MQYGGILILSVGVVLILCVILSFWLHSLGRRWFRPRELPPPPLLDKNWSSINPDVYSGRGGTPDNTLMLLIGPYAKRELLENYWASRVDADGAPEDSGNASIVGGSSEKVELHRSVSAVQGLFAVIKSSQQPVLSAASMVYSPPQSHVPSPTSPFGRQHQHSFASSAALQQQLSSAGSSLPSGSISHLLVSEVQRGALWAHLLRLRSAAAIARPDWALTMASRPAERLRPAGNASPAGATGSLSNADEGGTQ
jgi:hypothetical protein